MIKAAIIEDEEQVQSYIRKTLTEAFQQRGRSIDFEVFSNGERFLTHFSGHNHYDILFMDIEMPGADGISVCKRVREISNEALVVFISNKEELVFQSFEVQPFRFIRKSEYASQLEALTDSLIHRLSEMTPSYIKVHEENSDNVYSFDVKKILFVEAQRKNCRIVTTSGEVCVRCKLMNLAEVLTEFGFLQPHRSYIVNPQHISLIGKQEITLDNDLTVPFSRGKSEEIRQAFLSYTMR